MDPVRTVPLVAYGGSESFDMFRRLRVADYLTLSNALCGVLSIFSCIEHQFIAAFALMFLGYEFDCFDGRVARWRNECSDWGKELDSFSDLITFVLAPGVMLYCAGHQSFADQAGIAFFVLCGLTRLVRFNRIDQLVAKGAIGKAAYMEGLPSSYAALLVGNVVAVLSWKGALPSTDESSTVEDLYGVVLGKGASVHWATPFVVCLGTAMASRRLRLSFDGTYLVPAVTATTAFYCLLS